MSDIDNHITIAVGIASSCTNNYRLQQPHNLDLYIEMYKMHSYNCSLLRGTVNPKEAGCSVSRYLMRCFLVQGMMVLR